MCDYDHTGRIGDLIIDVAEAVQLVEEFLNDTQNYLRGRGVNL
jgi:hypothetical protein